MPPVPDDLAKALFYHPKVKRPFLYLPQNNALPETPATYGVHHETALTACFIIACNELGFLSTSADRSDVNAWVSLEHHQFLTSRKYYYHLATQPPNPNYCICTKFACWSFPHDHFLQLQSWGFRGETTGNYWSIISERIKQRDPGCRVTDWVDNKTTAYIVPANELKWMRSQNMELYTASPDAAFMDRDPRNLFALRWDIHTFQFDSGNLLTSITTNHSIPRTCRMNLYARFAWAVIKNADAMADRKAFNLETGGADAVAEEVDGGGPSNPQQQSGNIRGKGKGTKRRRSGRASGSKAPADPEALELFEDMAKAAKAAPFFLEPDGIANPYTYEQMVWYPGYKSVQRRKLEYMNAHPNIRATSGLCASPDTDSDEDIY
ncbi:hypothetical protein JOM56_012149 [Amanita muscaria]